MTKSVVVFFVFSFIFTSLCVSCQSSKNMKKVSSSKASLSQEKKGESPEWIHSPYEFCNEKIEFCTVGMGQDREEASKKAQEAMAQIFEVKVQGQTTIEDSLSQSSSSSESNLSIEKVLSTSVDEVLKGVQVKEVYPMEEDLYYALASLNKNVAARTLREDIRQIEDDLNAQVKKELIFSWAHILELIDMRDALYARYKILALTTADLIVTKTSVDESLSAKRKNLNFIFEPSFHPELKGVLENIIETYQISVVSDASKAQYKIISQVTFEPLHIKVKGFVKYQVSLHLKAIDLQSNKQVGEVFTEESAMGRSKSHVTELVTKKLQTSLYKQLVQLNI